MTQASNDTPVLALESRYYTDPAIFAQEKERIFFRTWQFACHASQVARPGDYVTFKIADQNLFVIRDTVGELQCFYNVCQHRAHELLSGAGNRKAIVCPYHAWTYQTNGRLRGAGRRILRPKSRANRTMDPRHKAEDDNEGIELGRGSRRAPTSASLP